MPGQEELREFLSAPRYSPSIALDLLCRMPYVKAAMESENSEKHPYTLREHTLMVCELYEEFAPWLSVHPMTRAGFRLLLLLHDVGKPEAREKQSKYEQHAYTIHAWKSMEDHLPLSAVELSASYALLSDDALGLYMRKKISIRDALTRLEAMRVYCPFVDRVSLLSLITTYYQMDSGGYTEFAYNLNPAHFSVKPKLEAMFAHDAEGRLVRHPSQRRLAFSEIDEPRFEMVREAWESTQ